MAIRPKKSESCCGPGTDCGDSQEKSGAAADAVREQVRAGYTKIAQSGAWSPLAAPGGGEGGGCCGPTAFSPGQLASAIGYSAQELAAAPEGANMGLSCGNPTALASLKVGETVL